MKKVCSSAILFLVFNGAEVVGPSLDEPESVRVYNPSNILSVTEFETVQFNLYSNPTKYQITIQLENPSDLQNVNIYNDLGQLVLTSKETIIDISKFITGLYVVEIETTKGTAFKKLIIE